MKDAYLMNIASFFYFVCYVPELYANYKNKNANVYNVPEKVSMLFGSVFALSYSVINNDSELIINYAPTLVLDAIGTSMRLYYAYRTYTHSQICRETEMIDLDLELGLDVENPIHS